MSRYYHHGHQYTSTFFLMRACKRKTRKKGFKERMKASYINKGVIYYKNGKFYDRNMKKDLVYLDIHCPFFNLFEQRERTFQPVVVKTTELLPTGQVFFLHTNEQNDPMCLITRKETAFCHLSAGYQESPIKHQSSLFMLPVLLTRISCFL